MRIKKTKTQALVLGLMLSVFTVDGAEASKSYNELESIYNKNEINSFKTQIQGVGKFKNWCGALSAQGLQDLKINKPQYYEACIERLKLNTEFMANDTVFISNLLTAAQNEPSMQQSVTELGNILQNSPVQNFKGKQQILEIVNNRLPQLVNNNPQPQVNQPQPQPQPQIQVNQPHVNQPQPQPQPKLTILAQDPMHIFIDLPDQHNINGGMIDTTITKGVVLSKENQERIEKVKNTFGVKSAVKAIKEIRTNLQNNGIDLSLMQVFNITKKSYDMKFADINDENAIKQELAQIDNREKLERERIENERIENERIERERIERERIENERRLENERIQELEREKPENEKLENEKLENEKLENERIENEIITKKEKEDLDKSLGSIFGGEYSELPLFIIGKPPYESPAESFLDMDDKLKDSKELTSIKTKINWIDFYTDLKMEQTALEKVTSLYDYEGILEKLHNKYKDLSLNEIDLLIQEFYNFKSGYSEATVDNTNQVEENQIEGKEDLPNNTNQVKQEIKEENLTQDEKALKNLERKLHDLKNPAKNEMFVQEERNEEIKQVQNEIEQFQNFEIDQNKLDLVENKTVGELEEIAQTSVDKRLREQFQEGELEKAIEIIKDKIKDLKTVKNDKEFEKISNEMYKTFDVHFISQEDFVKLVNELAGIKLRLKKLELPTEKEQDTSEVGKLEAEIKRINLTIGKITESKKKIETEIKNIEKQKGIFQKTLNDTSFFKTNSEEEDLKQKIQTADSHINQKKLKLKEIEKKLSSLAQNKEKDEEQLTELTKPSQEEIEKLKLEEEHIQKKKLEQEKHMLKERIENLIKNYELQVNQGKVKKQANNNQMVYRNEEDLNSRLEKINKWRKELTVQHSSLEELARMEQELTEAIENENKLVEKVREIQAKSVTVQNKNLVKDIDKIFEKYSIIKTPEQIKEIELQKKLEEEKRKQLDEEQRKRLQIEQEKIRQAKEKREESMKKLPVLIQIEIRSLTSKGELSVDEVDRVIQMANEKQLEKGTIDSNDLKEILKEITK